MKNISEKILLSNGIMNFFYKKKDCTSLSNFWECNIIIIDKDESREYDSGENSFHGEKFIRIGKICEDQNRKIDLLNYGKRFLKSGDFKTGNIAKKMGKKIILSKEELELWNILSISVQIEICKYKFENYEDVRNDLVKSHGKILVHPAMRCPSDKVKHKLWEGKGIIVDGKIEVIGKNMLGNLWMKLRDDIC